MPVSVLMPHQKQERETPDRDPLDTILKGLSIASTVYGIKHNIDASKLAQQKMEQESALQTKNDEFKRQSLVAEMQKSGFDPIIASDAGPVRPGDGGFTMSDWFKRQKDADYTKTMADATRKPTPDPMTNWRFQVAKEKDLESRGERLSGKLQNAGELNSAINSLETQLGFNLENYDKTTDDLPGVSIPFVGRVNAHSTDARNLNSRIAKIFNVELRDRSGAAVTHPELERLKQEFGAGQFNTEEELLGALQEYKSAFRDLTRNIEAGYAPEVVALRNERGGFTSGSISKPGTLRPPTSAAPQERFAGNSGLTTPSANAAPRGTPAPAPKVGTIQFGYRFKGGDPRNEMNWEPVR